MTEEKLIRNINAFYFILMFTILCISSVSAIDTINDTMILKYNNTNNSKVIEQNINLLFKSSSVINITRHPIIFGEPIKWTIYIKYGEAYSNVNYVTPPINAKQTKSLEGNIWITNITFNTNHSGVYYDIPLMYLYQM